MSHPCTHPISENFEISILFAGEYAKAKRTVKSGVEGSEKSSSVEVFCDELMDGRPLLQDVTIGKIYCALREKGSSEILRLRLHSNSAQGLLVFSMIIAHRTNISVADTKGVEISFFESPKSTLEVFAALGGLASLAQHLQLYQPAVILRAQT